MNGKTKSTRLVTLAAFAGICAVSACTHRVEKTVVEREPTKIVVERPAPEVIEHNRIVERRVDEYGNPIEERTTTTTTRGMN